MAYVRRPLTDDEFAKIDFIKSAVEEVRIPSKKWNWAIDEEREIKFVQLTSNTFEMREGEYWYLLIHSDKSYVIWVDAWGSKEIDGRKCLYSRLESPKITDSNLLSSVEALACEAMLAITLGHEGITFAKKPYR